MRSDKVLFYKILGRTNKITFFKTVKQNKGESFIFNSAFSRFQNKKARVLFCFEIWDPLKYLKVGESCFYCEPYSRLFMSYNNIKEKITKIS